MTDRTKMLTVLLDREYRDDDVQAIKDAIGMVRGVVKVDHEVSNGMHWQAENSAKWELRKQILELLK